MTKVVASTPASSFQEFFPDFEFRVCLWLARAWIQIPLAVIF